MRRRQLAAHHAGMFRQLQAAGAGRAVDIVDMRDPLPDTRLFHQLQRDVVILPARQVRPQGDLLHRERQPHLDARVIGPKVGLVVIQRRLDHAEGKLLLGMGIERPHDAAHVDALLFGLQADGAGHAGFQNHRRAVAGRIADRQAEVGNPDMLDARLGPPDQAGRPVLQIGHRRLVGGIGPESLRIAARQRRIALPRQQPAHGGIQLGDILIRGFARPLAQHGQRGFGLFARGKTVKRGGMDVHGQVLSVQARPSGKRLQFPDSLTGEARRRITLVRGRSPSNRHSTAQSKQAFRRSPLA